MKKKYSFILLLPLLVLSGCNFDINPADVIDPQYGNRKIYMGKNDIVLDLNEEEFVEIETMNLGAGGKTSTLSFTSSNPDVATAKYGKYEDEEAEYEGMYVSAKELGVTSIIASYKNANASCKVTVYDSHEIPFIHIKNTELSLEVDSEYILPSEIIYKSVSYNVLDNDITYSFDVLDGYDDIATLYQDDETNDIVVNPTKVGQSKVMISTVFKDKLATTILDINVNEVGYGIVINNDGFMPTTNNSYVAQLSISDFAGFSSSLDLDVKIYHGSTEVTGVVSFTSEDSSIVSVSNYTLQAHKIGSTVIYGEYKDMKLSILVVVSKPTIYSSLVNNTLEVERSSDFEIVDSSYVASSVLGVYLNTIDEKHNVYSSYDEGVFAFDMTSLRKLVSEFGKDNKIIIETEDVYIDTGLSNIYSEIIKTPEEFASWGELASKYKSGENKYDFNGYFLLGNNITCPDEGVQIPFDRNTNFNISDWSTCYDSNVGFNGVFDGQGYTVKNYLPVGNGAFITYLTKNGVLKNIGFDDLRCDITKMNSSNIAIVLVRGEGRIENIYANYKFIDTGPDVSGVTKYCCTFFAGNKTLSSKSVLVRADKASTKGEFDIVGRLMDAEGAYFIGGTHYQNKFYCNGIYKVFANESEMIDDLQTNSTVKNWDTKYWKNLETGIPEWKSRSN